MTLDEAIKHAEEVAEEKEKEGKLLCSSEAGSIGCLKCAEEHRQLAEWLKDYKRLKEQEPCEDAISLKAVIEWLKTKDIIKLSSQEETARKELKALPSVNPQKTGHWIKRYYGFKCSKCLIVHRHHSIYCPSCGARMVESPESEET